MHEFLVSENKRRSCEVPESCDSGTKSNFVVREHCVTFLCREEVISGEFDSEGSSMPCLILVCRISTIVSRKREEYIELSTFVAMQ